MRHRRQSRRVATRPPSWELTGSPLLSQRSTTSTSGFIQPRN
jgi:hypothetical protein